MIVENSESSTRKIEIKLENAKVRAFTRLPKGHPRIISPTVPTVVHLLAIFYN